MKTTLKQLKEETKYQINEARKSGIILINRNISDLTKNQTEKYKKYLEKLDARQ